MCFNDRLFNIVQYKTRTQMAPAFAYCCLLTGSCRCGFGFHFRLGAVFFLVDEAIKYQWLSNIEANVAVNITKKTKTKELLPWDKVETVRAPTALTASRPLSVIVPSARCGVRPAGVPVIFPPQCFCLQAQSRTAGTAAAASKKGPP